MKRAAPILLVLLALGAVAFWFWQKSQREHRFDNEIASAARRYGVEPALVKAVVWRESGFSPLARGRAGELGLMQLQEIAAQEWADDGHDTNFVHAHCLNARTNTLAGARYLAKVLRRYTNTDNALPYALADYNAGRGNVLKWLNGAAATNSAAFVEQIGFPGTRQYVLAIMQRRIHYLPEFVGEQR